MNTHRIDHRLSPLAHAQFFEAARQRALQARREAADEFWSAVGRALRRAGATGRHWLRRALSRGHGATAGA